MPILVFLLLSIAAFAQHSEQPQKESNSDLRSALVLFSVTDVGQKKTLILERTLHFDHFLRMKNSKGEEMIRKIDSKSAKALEMDFASRFLKCQYELVGLPGECKIVYQLMLKGESQEICAKDEKKSQEISPFIQSLSGRF